MLKHTKKYMLCTHISLQLIAFSTFTYFRISITFVRNDSAIVKKSIRGSYFDYSTAYESTKYI